MKSYHVHYLNKYGGHCESSESSMRAYDKAGGLQVCVEKNGAGQWVDRSEEYGLEGRHDLSPIPKECRAHKLYANGKIGRAEEYDERKPVQEAMIAKHGKVLSIKEVEVLEAEEKKKAKSA